MQQVLDRRDPPAFAGVVLLPGRHRRRAIQQSRAGPVLGAGIRFLGASVILWRSLLEAISRFRKAGRSEARSSTASSVPDRVRLLLLGITGGAGRPRRHDHGVGPVAHGHARGHAPTRATAGPLDHRRGGRLGGHRPDVFGTLCRATSPWPRCSRSWSRPQRRQSRGSSSSRSRPRIPSRRTRSGCPWARSSSCRSPCSSISPGACPRVRAWAALVYLVVGSTVPVHPVRVRDQEVAATGASYQSTCSRSCP